MPALEHDPALPPDAMNALEAALHQSQDVQAKVEACADDLSTANDMVKIQIAEGQTMLPAAVAAAQRHGWMLAVMFLDLDRFKAVNDTHGHAAGDRVLVIVAERLLKHTRDQDTVCRIGGDEFLYLLVDPAGRENVARIACLLQATLSEPMSVNGLEIVIRPSIGIAVYPDQATNADLLLAQADEAMYRSKRRQTGCEFYEPEDPQPR